MSNNALASFIEHCVLHGEAISNGQSVDEHADISFEFIPSSSETLDYSHQECDHWHDKTIVVTTTNPNALTVQIGDSVSIEYSHSNSMCESGSSCRSTSYEFIEN